MTKKMVNSKMFLAHIVIALMMTIQANAQYENVWLMDGNGPFFGAKLDFNGANPVISSIPFFSIGEATGSVSDEWGQLLFYSEGDTIWNRNGTVMPNAKGLTPLPRASYGSPYNNTNSTTQGVLIVPMINDPLKYYVFSLTDGAIAARDGVHGNLYYSIVDMTLDNGLGDVVPGKKGILIDSLFTESMSAVSGDSCNIWVIAAAYSRITRKSDLFKAYEITENGINMVPVISDVGGGVAMNGADCGSIKISGNRTRLARTRASLSAPKTSLELFDFSPATGVVSNRLNLEADLVYLGICFSPDNSKLYASGYSSQLYQFDLSLNPSVISSSKTLIDSNIFLTDIKCAPDGKLYYVTENKKNMSGDLKRIAYPNVTGIGCQPEFTGIELGARYANFPNVIAVPVIADTNYTVNHPAICSDMADIQMQPEENTSFSFRWDDGSTSNSRVVSQPGTYWVQHHSSCHYQVDTFIVTGMDLPMITVRVHDLGTTVPFSTYQWLLNGNVIEGATDSVYRVVINGDYSVVVSNGNGCIDTSAIYEVTNVTGIEDRITGAEQITVYPNPATDIVHLKAPFPINVSIFGIEGKQLKESLNTQWVSLYDLSEGIYLLKIFDADGNLLKTEKIIKTK